MPRRPRETAVIYAEKRLEPWGKWSRDNTNMLGLPRSTTLHKIMRRRLIRGSLKRKSKLTARGKETLSFRPQIVGEVPESVAEVDRAVAALSKNLQMILKTEYIDLPNSSIKDRCVAAGYSSRKYSELLECAKYSVFAALNY